MSENCDVEIKFKNGKIRIHHLVNQTDSDYNKLYQIAEFFAANGAVVELTPKISRPSSFKYECIYGDMIGTKFEGKCPDLKINGLWYEHEGFVTDNPKRAFSNMLSHGLKQSNRIIIDKPDLTDAYMKRIVKRRVADGQDIKEIWIIEYDETEKNICARLLYKKLEE